MIRLQHQRGAITNPKTGTPTALFYDLLNSLVDVVTTTDDLDVTEYTVLSNIRGAITSTRKQVEALEADTSLELIKGRLKQLEVQLEELRYTTPDGSVKAILKRLDDIEAQL